MKDSGIKCIGKIPANWNICRLRFLCNMKTGGTPPNKIGINIEEDGFPWITASDMDNTYKINTFTQYITKETIEMCNYKLFPPKSILLVCIASVGKLGIINTPCYANQQITALTSNDNINSKYLLYFIQSMSNKIVADASSNVVPIINTSYLKNINCILPPLQEQEKIANFLDTKCEEINSFHLSIERQIEKLEEYRKSIITEAITKGLNPNVEMKDSGIKWIGMIPKDWKVDKTKYIFKVVCGSTPNSSNPEYWDGDIDWITPADMQDFGTITNGKKNITNKGYNSCGTTIVPTNSIVISNRAPIGKVNITLKELCTNQGCKCLVSNDVCNNYFYYYFYSCNQELINLGRGTTFKELSTPDLENFQIILPSIQEQQDIANYLDEKCKHIDEAIATKKKELEVLEKYKKSLIYEYVTGKKEVPSNV